MTFSVDPGYRMSGWALADGREILAAGQCPPSADAIRRTIHSCRQQITTNPDMICEEQYVRDGFRSGKSMLKVARARGRWECWLQIVGWLDNGAELPAVSPQTWHAWLRRQGHSAKQYPGKKDAWKRASRAFVAKVLGRPLKSKDHNAADAACLALFGESRSAGGDLFTHAKKSTKAPRKA